MTGNLILYLFIAFLSGAALVYLLFNLRLRRQSSLYATLQVETAKQQEALRFSETQVSALQDEKAQLKDSLTEVEGKLSETLSAVNVLKAQLAAEQEKNSSEATLRKQQFEQQLQTVQEQFSNLASRILNTTKNQLKEENSEAMSHITAPLKEHLDKLQVAIQETNTNSARSTASLSEQLKHMAEQTDKMSRTATTLTSVMRGSNKAQGNWGEQILTNLLETCGFREGTDFDTQFTIKTADGTRISNEETSKGMQPDVVLHYPNNEDVVVDAKMVVQHYYDYVTTDDVPTKQLYAQKLVQAIRTQAKGLAKKDYSSYIVSPRHAIDFVIMFVPNEGALQLAMATDARLWADAFDQQVFICGPQNFTAILKLIQIAWRQHAQSENQERVYGLAEDLLKRVGEFVERFKKFGKQIDDLHKTYDSTLDKAMTGKMSIVQKANQLKMLGVKEHAKYPIPRVNGQLADDDIDDEEDEK